MSELGLQALLISRPQNRRYLTGFTGSAGMALVTATEAYLLTDFRYIEQARVQAPHFEIVRTGLPGQDALKEKTISLGLEQLGFEQHFVTYMDYQDLYQRLALSLVPQEGLVEKLRAVKDEDEIAHMQKAAQIAEAAWQKILPQIKVGKSEQEIALELEIAMRRLGAEGLAFPIIAASGPRSALPHGAPTQRLLQKGDFLTLDFGAVYGGYCSDMTRTLVLGEASPKQEEIYELVLKAQLVAQEAVKPGLSGKELDDIARSIIADAGYGEYFGHGLGHGVGLEVHEAPRASRISQDLLEPGMIVTIEPGIYLPGFGGVRIEDMILVTESGHHNFNSSHKELIRVLD